MGLFGANARIYRCQWWQELTHWPNGASEEDLAGCVDRFMNVGEGGTPSRNTGQAKRLESTIPASSEHRRKIIGIGLILAFAAYAYFKYKK